MNPVFHSEYPLSRLSVGKSAVIKRLDLTGSMRRRILDFGIIPGTSIKCTQKSPIGSIAAYYVRGTVVAIRPEDAEHIIINSESDNI